MALKQAKAKAKGKRLSYDTAMEEVVADGMETILKDGKVVEFMADVKQKDHAAWEKIKGWFKNLAKFLQKMVDAYKGQSAQTIEGAKVAEFSEDLLNQIKQIWGEGAVTAGENYKAAEVKEDNTENGGVKHQIRGDIVDVTGKEYDSVVELEYKVFSRVKRSGGAYIDFIRNNLIKKKITVLDGNGGLEVIEFAGPKERVWKDGANNDHAVIGELLSAKNDIKKLVILNAVETASISRVSGSNTKHSHQWLDENGWQERTSYVMTEKGIIYPVILKIARARDGRNILYDVHVNIEEGIAADKTATSLRAKKQAGQAVGTTMPSNRATIHQHKPKVKHESAEPATLKSERNTFAKTAVAHFGRTYSWKETGYLLTDGARLDFSGRHEGAAGGYRTVDHRAILDIYPEDTDLDGNGAMVDFMRQGNIRIMPEGEGINLQVQPTKAQEQALDDFISRARGEVILDIDDANGNTVVSVEYPRGTRASKVLQDIRNYFENGTEPVVSDVSRFRYSDRDSAKTRTFKNGQNAKGEFITNVLVDLADSNSEWWTGRYNRGILGMSKSDDTEFRQFYQEILKRTKEMDEYGESDLTVEDSFVVQDGKGRVYIYRVALDGYLHGVVIEKIDKAKYEAVLQRETKGGNHGKPNADIKRRARDAWNDLGRDRSGDGRTPNSDGATGYGRVDSGSPQSNKAGNDSRRESTYQEVPTVTDPDGALHQDRDSNSISNRTLLANALGSVAQNDMERNRIAEYKEKIAQLDAQEKKLRELNAQIKEMSFAKGPRDTKKIRELRDEAIMTTNRIGIYDKQLLRLEASAPLQKVLEREKSKAYKKAEQEGQEALRKMREEYGTIPRGEKAVRDDALPISTDGKNRVSRTARTVKGAEVTPDEFARRIDTEVAAGELTYLPISNDKTSKDAEAWVEKLGWTAAHAEWQKDVGRGKTGAAMVARGAVLLNNAAQAGDRNAWREILFSYQQLSTNTAQGLQALHILKKLAPEDRLYMVKRSVEQMVEDMHLKTEITLDEELLKAYRMAKSNEARDVILDQIQQSVADQLTPSFMDKFTALRYLNMLGNLRTQVRNLLGNSAMKAVAGAKNAIAAALENVAYLASGKTFQRTRSFVVDKTLLRAAKADYKVVEGLLLDGGKYSTETAESSEFAKQVKEKRTIFKNRLLEKYREVTNWAMDQGDLLFSKAAYGRALAGYLQARGITDMAKADTELLDEARLFAVKEAQEQTFRDTNWLSGWFSKMGRRKDTPAIGRIIGEGVMPFRKTPANILMRAEEYSPLGLFNSLFLTARAMSKDSGVTGDQVINSWAKTLTGSMLFALGMWLSAVGGLTGGPDDDEELDSFESMYGLQNYAIVLPDGTNLTFDWVSPAAIPILMGAQMMELAQEDGFQLSDLEPALTSLMEPMVEMSMLQGVKDALDNVQYAENNLGQMVITFGLNYLTQGMTSSLLGQIERTFQDSREMTYVDKNSAVPGWLQRTIGTAFSKLPGVDYNQAPYINAWGEEEQNPNVLLNAIYNIISPSYVNKAETDDVYDELVRLNEAQDEKNVLPSTPEKTYKGRNLTADEYVALAKAQGQTQRKLVEDLISSAGYKAMSDTEKAKAISFVYKYAKEKAQIEVLSRDEFSAKWMREINGDVAAAIIEHVKEG